MKIWLNNKTKKWKILTQCLEYHTIYRKKAKKTVILISFKCCKYTSGHLVDEMKWIFLKRAKKQSFFSVLCLKHYLTRYLFFFVEFNQLIHDSKMLNKHKLCFELPTVSNKLCKRQTKLNTIFVWNSYKLK